MNINEILIKKVHNHRSVVPTTHGIQVIDQSMQNLYLMNTSLSEHFLDSPVGVHYMEVLLYLDMNQSNMRRHSRLTFNDRSRNLYYSSNLHTLFVNVKTFDDCLFLLDGRLKNLSSLTVRVSLIERSPTITDSHVGKELRLNT